MEIMYNEETGKFELAKQPYIEKILALSKPRKPIKSDRQGIRYVTTYECPNCGREFIGNGLLNYCYNCGQKLDWSDEMDGEE